MSMIQSTHLLDWNLHSSAIGGPERDPDDPNDWQAPRRGDPRALHARSARQDARLEEEAPHGSRSTRRLGRTQGERDHRGRPEPPSPGDELVTYQFGFLEGEQLHVCRSRALDTSEATLSAALRKLDLSEVYPYYEASLDADAVEDTLEAYRTALRDLERASEKGLGLFTMLM